jgi:hypothetical protein
VSEDRIGKEKDRKNREYRGEVKEERTERRSKEVDRSVGRNENETV